MDTKNASCHKHHSLFHETGVVGAFAIIQQRRIASITSPYPGEFLRTRDDPQFTRLGGFKRRGIVLEFRWSGLRENILEREYRFKSTKCKVGILYDVYLPTDREPEPEPENETAHLAYWCSHIYGPVHSGLRLIGASARGNEVPEEFRSGDWNEHCDNVAPENIEQLNDAIGDGIDISITGIIVDRHPQITMPTPPRKSWWSRFWP